MGAQVSASSTGLNEAIVHGQLVTEPETRELPSGAKVVAFSLTVRRPGEKTTSVPMSWFDPPQRIWSWQIGDMVVARGQVVRRFYRAAGGLGSATEVVVAQAVLEEDRGAAKRVFDRSLKAIERTAASVET